LQTSDGSTFDLFEEKAAEFNWTSETLVDRKLSQLNPLDHLLSKETCLSQKLSLNKVRGLVHRMVSSNVVETELGEPTDFTCNQILADDMIIHYRTGTVGVHTLVKPGVIIMYDIIESNVQGENVPIKVNFGVNVVILAHVHF
jgi:hypothetical protein